MLTKNIIYSKLPCNDIEALPSIINLEFNQRDLITFEDKSKFQPIPVELIYPLPP